MLHPRDPHLLTSDNVVIALSRRGGLDLGRVRARRRLRNGKGLQPQLAGCDAREIVALLLIGAVPKKRAHDVHLRVTGPGIRARPIDLFQDHGRLSHTEPAAAILGRDQRREPTGLGERPDECLGVCALPLDANPVGAVESAAELTDRLAVLGEAQCARIDLRRQLRHARLAVGRMSRSVIAMSSDARILPTASPTR